MAFDYSTIFDTIGGLGSIEQGYSYLTTVGINLPIGANPPYGSADFFAMYPKFNDVSIPVPVINAYIAYASGCLSYARYLDSWKLAMGWFVAHYLTLYARSDGPSTNIASSGLAFGIQTSKSAGDVSVGYTLLDMPDAGQWSLTTYGQQFWNLAKVIGSGGMLLI